MSHCAKRIIPCLDIKNNRVVKGVNFEKLLDAGDPVEIARRYNEEGADELAFLDITASLENRSTTIQMVKNIAREIFIPFTVGGGIASLSDICNLLDAGCDKVTLNSSAINNPVLINEAAQKFGSQCIIVAVDTKKMSSGDDIVFANGGRINTGIKTKEWILECYRRGAGEILLTSMDHDGTKAGFDTASINKLSKVIDIPIIASGGAGTMSHIEEAFRAGADAALAASIFHFQEISIKNLKHYLLKNGVEVRL